MDSPHPLPLPEPGSQGGPDPGAQFHPGLAYTLTLEPRPARGTASHEASGRVLPGVGSRGPRTCTSVRVAAGDLTGLTLTLGR
jgi:hypothetical protein